MTNWVSSDWHLFHRNIQKFCPFTRKGETVEDMSHTIVHNIGNTLKPGDTLFNVGDVSFGSEADTYDLLNTIKMCGINHVLILGNHDGMIRKSSKLQSCFSEIHTRLEYQMTKKTLVVMDHFPMQSWNGSHRGSYHLHGHCHSAHQTHDNMRRMDIGIDSRPTGDMMPWRLDEVIEILKPNAFGAHHD